MSFSESEQCHLADCCHISAWITKPAGSLIFVLCERGKCCK